MKKIFGSVLIGVFGLYFLSVAVMTPYYNWRYAKEHGFIKWLFFGEIVSTLKAVAWPYFTFASTSSSAPYSPDERHYGNSKKACDEAMKVIVNAGDVTRLGSDERTKVAELLELAIAEANQVQQAYLQEVHPEFPTMYENYKHAMGLLVGGLHTDNTSLVLAGAYGYNEFAQWLQSHRKELSF